MTNDKPILVVVPGGGWFHSDVNAPNLQDVEAFRKLGMDVYRVNYAQGPGSFGDNVKDLLGVHRFLKHHRPDSPIYWCGTSAGAHVSFIMATFRTEPKLDAFIGFYGFYDHMVTSDLRADVQDQFHQMMGDENPIVKNPMINVDRMWQIPKVLLFHGIYDELIDKGQSVRLHEALPESRLHLTEQNHAFPIMQHAGQICEWLLE